MTDEIKIVSNEDGEIAVTEVTPEEKKPEPRKRKAVKAALSSRTIYYTHTHLHRSPLYWSKGIATFLDGIDGDAIKILLERGDLSVVSVTIDELTALKSYGTILTENGYTSVAAILDANTDDLAKTLTMRTSEVFALQDRMWQELATIAKQA